MERFTLWPCPPNSSISLLLSKALANFSHFRQICHLLQNRRCDFSPFSVLFFLGGGGGVPFATASDLQVRLWRFFAILVNVIIFVKITTFKGPLCHLIENFVTTGECSPYSLPIPNSPFSPNMPLSSKSQLLMGTLSFVITYLPNLANFRHFCHWAHFWT